MLFAVLVTVARVLFGLCGLFLFSVWSSEENFYFIILLFFSTSSQYASLTNLQSPQPTYTKANCPIPSTSLYIGPEETLCIKWQARDVKKQKSSSSEAPHDSHMIALFISKSVSPNLISGNNVLNSATISFKLNCLDLFLSLLLVSDFLCYCLLPSPHLYNSLSLLYILIIRVTYTAFSITHSGILS